MHLLAEDQAPQLDSLVAGNHVARTASETSQPIDDLNFPTVGGPMVYLQAKRAVRQLVDRVGSDFTDFVTQAVDQHIALGGAAGAEPDARYVVATSSEAAGTVRHDLRVALDDLRAAPADADVATFGSTAEKQSAIKTTIEIVERVLRARGVEPTTALVRAILSRISVWVLDPDGDSARIATNLLSASVLSRPGDAAAAWSVLRQRAEAAQLGHETLDIAGWRQALELRGLSLKAIPSFMPDVERLRANGTGALGDLGRRGQLRLGTSGVHVERDVVAIATELAKRGPLVVLGDPGSGKSAVLADLARED